MMIRTISGNYLDIAKPNPDNILLSDIIFSLSHENRFNGHTLVPYSVAHHTVAMVRFAERFDYPLIAQRAAWLHDTPEYVLKDVVTPLKQHIRDVYGPLTIRWEDAICDRCGNGLTGDTLRLTMEAGLKNLDEEFYHAESFVLQDNDTFKDASAEVVRQVRRIMTCSPAEVRAVMLGHYERLFT